MDTLIKNMILSPFNILYRFKPSLTLKILFYLKQHYMLNLNHPRTYNEKIQWIKLYDKNPLMPKCCDKYTVRAYVKKMGCGELLNDLLWSGGGYSLKTKAGLSNCTKFKFKNNDKNFEKIGDIPFEYLPEKFVIKVTHGSSFNIIVTDKNQLDRNGIRKKCKKWLSTKFIPCYGE